MQEVDRVRIKQVLAASMILLIQTILLSGCMHLPNESESAVQIGSAAPDFKLPDLNGQTVSLDQFKGKIVILDFWATWCGPCQITMPLLEKLQKEYPESVVLLAISLDQEPADVVRDFVHQQGLSARVLLDERGVAAELYGTESIPMHVIIDKKGIVRYIQFGYHEKMLYDLRAQIEALK